MTPFRYVGTVWCVKVPTGAFVARRNGKVFVTGNSGFPKSLDVSKAIDKEAGLERPRVPGGQGGKNAILGARKPGEAISGEAIRWSGWGTALKPAYEPIILARKPMRGTVAANVQAFGTGAINVDGCRIAHASAEDLATSQAKNPGRVDTVSSGVYGGGRPQQRVNADGRWPANVLLDEDAAAVLDAQSGELKSPATYTRSAHAEGEWLHAKPAGSVQLGHGDSGGASRFFYVAKASGEDRARWAGNNHPTVKPTDVMRWLCRLITRPGGLVLDPFMGSGSTGVAAAEEGFRFIGIDLDPHHVEIAERRMRHATRQPSLL